METQAGRNVVSLIVGLLLVGLGAVLFLAQITEVDLLSVTWPFFIIVPGLVMFVAMVMGGKRAAGLAVPASIVTTVGLILLYQNTFDHWESWSYAWTLIFPTAVGVGLAIRGVWGDNPDSVRVGMRMAAVGLIIFVIAGAFFEFVLNISGLADSTAAAIVGAAALIAAGIIVIGWGALRPGRRIRP